MNTRHVFSLDEAHMFGDLTAVRAFAETWIRRRALPIVHQLKIEGVPMKDRKFADTEFLDVGKPEKGPLPKPTVAAKDQDPTLILTRMPESTKALPDAPPLITADEETFNRLTSNE